MDEWQIKWSAKKLDGQFLRATDDIRAAESWKWLVRGEAVELLVRGDVKKETEGMIVAAQDQALRRNWMKMYISKQGTTYCAEEITHTIL